MQIVINISDTDVKCLENDLLDVEQWVKDAVAGKIGSCKKRMISAYKSPLVNKTDDELVEIVTALPEYKNRKAREAEK